MKPPALPALVIGGGPAGLMAAEALLSRRIPVLLAEARPSPGRKLLMAGEIGVNVTRDEPVDDFITAYDEATDWLAPMLDRFGPQQVQDWVRGLGQEVFTGSSGKVFPRCMKASPLLRRWLGDLQGQGLTLRTRWRWTGFQESGFVFETPAGRQVIEARCCVLALGGKSWARLGSDGQWADILTARGVDLAPFEPANMGFTVDWSTHMARHFGQPLKSIVLKAGGRESRGEIAISARGLEGGGLYLLSKPLRRGAALQLDLFPDLPLAVLAERLSQRPARESTVNKLRKALAADDLRLALLQEFARPLPRDVSALAALLKAVPVPLGPPRLIDEAISVAGGVRREACDDGLMLRALPGVFVAGEMLDWEAPTGGYLLTACLATGLHAGLAAANWSAAKGDTGDDEAGAT